MELLLESGRMKLTMRMMRLLMMVIMRLLMMVMVRLMMMVMMMMTMTRHELFDAEERAGNIDGFVFVCILLLLLLVTSDFVTFVFRSGDLFGFHSLNNPYNLEGLSGITIDSINHSLWVHIFLVSIYSNKVDIA